MLIAKRLIRLGIVAGIALFLAGGLELFIGSSRARADVNMKSKPIAQATIAPAQTLSDARVGNLYI